MTSAEPTTRRETAAGRRTETYRARMRGEKDPGRRLSLAAGHLQSAMKYAGPDAAVPISRRLVAVMEQYADELLRGED